MGQCPFLAAGQFEDLKRSVKAVESEPGIHVRSSTATSSKWPSCDRCVSAWAESSSSRDFDEHDLFDSSRAAANVRSLCAFPRLHEMAFIMSSIFGGLSPFTKEMTLSNSVSTRRGRAGT